MTGLTPLISQSTAYMQEASSERYSMSSSMADGEFFHKGAFLPRATEEERGGRRSNAGYIGTTGTVESRSFRVRLTHTATPVGYPEPLNRVVDVSSSSIEGGVSWRESAEQIINAQDRLQCFQHKSEHQEQPQEDQQMLLQRETPFVGHGAVLPSRTSAAAAFASPPQQVLETQPCLGGTAAKAEAVVCGAEEQLRANNRRDEVRYNHETILTELGKTAHVARSAGSVAKCDAIPLKEFEWPEAKASVGQRPKDEIVSYLRRSLEAALRERERELQETHDTIRAERKLLAESLQREEVLRSRLLVAEETRVLYQLYLQRLLDVLRAGATDHPGALPFVSQDDVLTALSEALRTTDGTGDTLHEFTPQGTRWTATLPRQLTNATLLMSSMLESKMSDCLALWRRDEKRRHEGLMQMLQVSVNTCADEMEAKLALVSSALRRTEQRVMEYGKATATALERYMRSSNTNGERVEQLQSELRQVNHDHVQSQRQLQRAQAEISGLREEIARMDADRETALLMHRASECLEDVRQSVRNAVRSAAHDIEQCTLESNTLNEPFIQSMRVIAVKVEAHAEIARSAARREKQEWPSDSREAAALHRKLPLERDEMYRRILSPPRRSSKGREWEQTQQPSAYAMKADVVGESGNLMMLEELGRMMKNVCRLLENNSRQMASNSAKVTQAIASWESAIVGKMTDIWEFMRGALVASGLSPPPPPPAIGVAQQRVWSADAPLVLGGVSADGQVVIGGGGGGGGSSSSHSHSHSHSHNGNNNSSSSNCSTTTRTMAQQSQVSNASAVNLQRYSHTGSIGASCSLAPSASYAPSCISSSDANGTACSASGASLWRTTLAPPAEVQRSPDLCHHYHHGAGQLSPPSIAVSRAPTPPPPSSSSLSSSRAINALLPQQQQQQKQQQQQQKQHHHHYHQRQQLLSCPPCRMVSPRNGPSTTSQLHYISEMDGLEGSDTRVGSGAILVRRAGNSS